MSIPKVIHYCWFGGSQLPKEYQEYIDEWRMICPDYKIIQWNERNYDVNKCEFTKFAYEHKKWAFVSDYARIDIVNMYGGIYLDVDVQLIKKLDDLLDYSAFFGIEKDINKDYYVSTGLGFGSIKNNSLLTEIIELYHSQKIGADYSFIPCPILQRPIFERYGFLLKNTLQTYNDMVFLPTEYLSPINCIGKLKITNNTHSIHHYYASWKEMNEQDYLYKKFVYYFGSKYGELLFQVIKRIGFIKNE